MLIDDTRELISKLNRGKIFSGTPQVKNLDFRILHFLQTTGITILDKHSNDNHIHVMPVMTTLAAPAPAKQVDPVVRQVNPLRRISCLDGLNFSISAEASSCYMVYMFKDCRGRRGYAT